ncbi:hypothetical protein U1Q18_044757 [Sarracenia purpurea var. burkii]
MSREKSQPHGLCSLLVKTPVCDLLYRHCAEDVNVSSAERQRGGRFIPAATDMFRALSVVTASTRLSWTIFARAALLIDAVLPYASTYSCAPRCAHSKEEHERQDDQQPFLQRPPVSEEPLCTSEESGMGGYRTRPLQT